MSKYSHSLSLRFSRAITLETMRLEFADINLPGSATIFTFSGIFFDIDSFNDAAICSIVRISPRCKKMGIRHLYSIGLHQFQPF